MQNGKIPLSIVICSVRPINTAALLLSLIQQLEELDQVIVIFDIVIEPAIQNIFSTISSRKTVEIYYNQSNQGLSFCRNFGMHHSKNSYAIFFDDDVLLPDKILTSYRRFFSQGLPAIGGPLKLPQFYTSLPLWLPKGFSSLLGIHTFQKRIWGANFGFNLKIALQNKIFFKGSLGRKNGGLQSGDETDFLQRYCQYAGESRFVEELFVYHCVDLQRFKIPYLLKRAFWQGKSEVRKMSVIEGIRKEFRRATHISDPQLVVRLAQRIIGMVLFLNFCLGILIELTFQKKSA